jgi:magnesium-transporting ATPase (P-type)
MKHEQLGGLSSHEVAARRRRDGFNELPDREKRNIFTMIISVLSEPMIFLLVAVVRLAITIKSMMMDTIIRISWTEQHLILRMSFASIEFFFRIV